MADSHNSDRSLLDRLNALKPSSVTLDASTNSLNIPTSGVQPAEPPSREDALSERLRTLRNRREEAGGPLSSSGATVTPPSAGGDPPPPYAETEGGGHHPRAASAQPPSGSVKRGPVNERLIDDLFGEDDRTLDEILEGLDLEGDQWTVEDDEGKGRGDKNNGDDDSQRVAELLERLKAEPVPHDDQCQDGADKDDSEGEEMARQVDRVLARAMDEIKIEDSTTPARSEESKPPEPPPVSAVVLGDKATEPTGRHEEELSLPAVPQDDGGDKDTRQRSHTAGDKAALKDVTNTNEPPSLSLPTVPTTLKPHQPPLSNPPAETTDPFETSITARMAALKGTTPAALQTDPFGLPSVPTFSPDDRPPVAVAGGRLASRTGYTDEDAAAWCIVCLEDAALRCEGCGGDVYCARCWRDMHVGPAAGYDERGHRAVRFTRS